MVELALRVTREQKACQWALEQELDLDKPIDLLVHDIEAAIDIATKADEQQLNYNFDYNWRAYQAVSRGLSQLKGKHAIEEAKTLTLKLIDKGSYQMECSDEGMMQEDIESCLRVVISAVVGLPGANEWALEMLHRDRCGFLCEQELREMAGASRSVP